MLVAVWQKILTRNRFIYRVVFYNIQVNCYELGSLVVRGFPRPMLQAVEVTLWHLCVMKWIVGGK